MADWRVAEEMTKRIVERFKPDKVIVFGSLARGEIGPDSDIDFLVVMEMQVNRRETTVAILRALADFSVPKDVIVMTPEEFESQKDLAGTVAFPAARDGRLLHAA